MKRAPVSLFSFPIGILIIGLGAAKCFAEFIGEGPTVKNSFDHQLISESVIDLTQLRAFGRELFTARFNYLDGMGEGDCSFSAESSVPAPRLQRSSRPLNPSACVSCHHQPSVGGAGDVNSNSFVVNQVTDTSARGNERNSLGIHGAGLIELLAREITEDLQKIRDRGVSQAAASGNRVRLELMSKGIHFGFITVLPDGRINPNEIDGIDWDLVIKPFHQNGMVVSLREFTVNALAFHHGIQAEERFGYDQDPDCDGVVNELSVGDVTALVAFQATLAHPRQLIPAGTTNRENIELGEKYFSQIGCDQCHRRHLRLRSNVFTEPNPFNPKGILLASSTDRPLRWALSVHDSHNILTHKLGTRNSSTFVSPFTDFKRHTLCDQQLKHFCNEKYSHGTLVGTANPGDFTVPNRPRPINYFITRKLWDVAVSSPFGHRGDLSTLGEAIYFHGGDARTSRDAYYALSETAREEILRFLLSLGENLNLE